MRGYSRVWAPSRDESNRARMTLLKEAEQSGPKENQMTDLKSNNALDLNWLSRKSDQDKNILWAKVAETVNTKLVLQYSDEGGNFNRACLSVVLVPVQIWAFHAHSMVCQKNLPQLSAAVPATAFLLNEPGNCCFPGFCAGGEKKVERSTAWTIPSLVGVLENSSQAELGSRPTEPLAIEE